MNDNELKKAVESINQNVERISERIGGRWAAMGRGVLTGFGSVVGAGLAILIIGFILNVIGVIPAFREQSELWREALKQTRTGQTITK
jgi:hypothetical protein